MKKTILAALVAASIIPATAAADVTLFGTMEGAVEMFTGDADGSDVVFGDSEIGLKTTEDLGGETSAFGFFSFDIDGEDNGGLRGYNSAGTALEVDQMYLGLSNVTFGTARIGRYDTLSAVIGDNTIDQFEGRSQDVTFSDVYGNGVNYTTPTFYGFSGSVSLVMDGDNPTVTQNKENVDLTELSLTYEGHGAYVGLSYLEGSFAAQDTGIAALKDADAVVLAASYNFGGENNWRVNGAYEQLDTSINGVDDGKMWALGAAADFGNNTVLVGYQDYSDHPQTNPTGALGAWGDADVMTIEGQHHFSKRTKVYANYQQTDNKQTDMDFGVFNLGMRHDF